ncbi:MAG: hypothetical protein AAFQ98_26795, partial [Bacteroidota bacterium]
MKTITKLARLCLASVVLLAASTQVQAQSISPISRVPCGATEVYTVNSNSNVQINTYAWTVTFSSGGGTSGGGPSLAVNFPNSPGTASVSVSITGSRKEYRWVYNTQTQKWERIQVTVPFSSFLSTTTVIGDLPPPGPSVLQG